MKEIIKYKCDYCSKDYVDKNRTIEHEESCLRNPKNKSCSTCTCGYDNYCEKTDKLIYQKGQAIIDCPCWEQDLINEEF